MINQEIVEYIISSSSTERKYLLNDDFLHWFLYYYIDYVKFDFAQFHFEMFQDIKDLSQGNIRELAWIMFRESAKTSIAKGFITWMICTNKRKYINVDAFDKENAERMLFDAILELQRNPRILADYGELYNAKRNSEELTQKKISNFLTNNNIRVEAHSTQESIRGRLHGSQRPDCLILDDFETNKTKDSEAYTAQVAGHISEAQSGMDANGIVLYLGNYITEYGNVARLFKRSETDPRLRVRRVDVVVDGKPAWPEKYCMTDLEAQETKKISIEDIRRKLGSQVFDAEMMNNPINATTQEFKSTWFKYVPMDNVSKMKTRKFATIDPAFTKRETSDWTGVTKNYVDREDNWYFDAQHYKINSTDLIGMIFTLHGEGFEKIGIEQGAFSEMIEPFFQKECQERRVYPYVISLKHGGVMKETRIRSLIPRYEQGKIFHIEGRCRDLESELLRFPKGKNDDIADSAQYQNKIAEVYISDEEANVEFGMYSSTFV